MFRDSDFNIFSISSVLADAKDVMDHKYAILKVQTSKMKLKETLKGVMERVAAFFAWNFQVLQDGIMPTSGFYGEPLASHGTTAAPLMDGFSCAFAFFKCDTKARVEANGFRNYYQCTHICDDCFATQPYAGVLKKRKLRLLLYFDMSASAAWLDTMISHELYMMHSDYVSPWALVPGWRKELVQWDWMHIGPLGFLRDYCGALCMDMIDRSELSGLRSVDVAATHVVEVCGCLRSGRGLLKLICGRLQAQNAPNRFHINHKRPRPDLEQPQIAAT
jgi:hypothetical protein